MNDSTLSRLYRRLAGVREQAWLDPAELVAAAVGEQAGREQVAEVLAQSSAQAALVRLLRELEPESASLAREVARLGCAHSRRARESRRASSGRRFGPRGVIGLAACVAVAFGLALSMRTALEPVPLQLQTGAGSAVHELSPARSDQIFAASMDASRAAPDRIFRDEFALGG